MVRKTGEPAGGPEQIRVAAGNFIESRGLAALGRFAEHVDLTAELGHKVAAATWRELADATADLLGDAQDSRLIPTRIARRMPRVWLH